MFVVGFTATPVGETPRPIVAVTLFVASIVGAAIGLALIPLRGKSLKTELPFGCFLTPAAMLALLKGRILLAAYLDRIHVGP